MFLSKYEDHPDLRTGLVSGPPQPTFYSKREEFRPTYASVKHLIDAGYLTEIFGDFEATGANKEQDKPKDGAFKSFDLMQQQVSQIYVPMAVAQHDVYSAGASLVGNIWPDHFDKGYPPFIAAAMVRDYFAENSRIDGQRLGLPLIDIKDNDRDRKAFLYTLTFPDTTIELEIKLDGKMFRPRGTEKWKKIYAVWHPFNGENYDDFLTSHWYASVGSEHLFNAVRRSHNMVRIDARPAAMHVWAFGKQGQTGMVLPTRYRHQTRNQVLSTRLGDIAEFHDPAHNRARGTGDGTYYPDGRTFDRARMHGSMEDTDTTVALYYYMRRRFPDELRHIEMLASEQTQKDFMQGGSDLINRDLRGFYYYDQGMLTRRIGILNNTGDKFGQLSRNELSILNLSAYDPRDLRNKSDSELRNLIVRRDDPLLVHHRGNRTPIFTDFDTARAAGVGVELSPEEFDNRRKALVTNQDEMERIAILAHEIRTPSKTYNVQAPRRLETNDYAHYGDPEYIPLRDPTTGHIVAREPMDIYKRRWKQWKVSHEVDNALKAGTQGQPTDYSNDNRGLNKRLALEETTTKRLKRVTGHWRYPVSFPTLIDESFGIDDVRKLDWIRRWETKDMLFSLTPNCWVENERGQHLPWQKVLAMPYHLRGKLWPKPNVGEDFTESSHLRIFYQRDADRHPTINFLVAFEADRFYRKYENREWLDWWIPFFDEHWGQHRTWHDAYVTLNVQGPPNLSPSEHPFMTEARKLTEIIKWKNGAATDEKSDYIRMVLSQPQGQRLLAAIESDCRQRLSDYPWTPERLEMMGYDARTRNPIIRPNYTIDRDRAYRLMVPDAMLDNPRWHEEWHQHLVIADPDGKTTRILEQHIAQSDPLVLVGARTHIERMAVAPSLTPLPLSADGEDAKRASASAYATIGQNIGQNPFLFTFQQLAPIHGGVKIDETMQMVSLSALDFAALVDAGAGSMGSFGKTLTTIITPDLGIQSEAEFTPGPIRLRRKMAGSETGDEYQGTVISAKRITVDDLNDWDDSRAQQAGHSSAANLYSAWRKVFAELGRRDPTQQKLWQIDLKPVDKKSYAYFKPEELPVAVYRPEAPKPRRRKITKEAA